MMSSSGHANNVASSNHVSIELERLIQREEEESDIKSRCSQAAISGFESRFLKIEF